MTQSPQIEINVNDDADVPVKFGATGEQRVHRTILGEEDAVKLDAFCESLKASLASKHLSDAECFDDIFEEAYQENPELRDEA